MRQNLTLKIMILFGLTFVFAIALLFIGGVVSERERYRDKVVADVGQSLARAQTITGPVVVVPWRERIASPTTAGQPAVPQEIRGESVVLPEVLECKSSVHAERRTRGLYGVPVYRATLHLSGSFRLPARLGLSATRETVDADPPTLIVAMSDARGLRRAPKLRFDGADVVLAPGTRRPWLGEGVSTPLPAGPMDEARVVPFELDLELMGTDRLAFVPVGAATRITMHSDWPHPSFTEGFMPDARTVTAKGFDASWELSEYGTGTRDALERARLEARNTVARGMAGVRFVEPIDVYRQSERAAKYGLLFVLLTFVAFFLFEVLRRLAVHPVQYALAGAAVALFFLLLLSLSEYLAFPIAYLVASGACVALLTFYVGHVLGGLLRGLGFGAMLAALYGVLYVLLQSEDYALLLGTLLLFGVLTAVMVITRRVDWYRLGESPAPGRATS